MFIPERARVECRHYAKRDQAVRQDHAWEEGNPRFLAQALSWVEFQRIVLRRQCQDLGDSSDEDVCEAPGRIGGSLIL